MEGTNAAHRDTHIEERGAHAFVSEFLGTLLLVFFIVAVLSGEIGGLGYADFAVIGLLHMFILAVIIYAFADTSGGVFNPAVTIALASVRRISPANALTYVVVQLAGGVAGALLAKVVFLDPGRVAHYGAATINRAAMHGTPLRALIAEALGTFILVLAIMATAVNPRGPKAAAGLIIGASLALGVMVFGPLTGAGFNPARWFGPALVVGKYSDAWVYIVGPLVGGVLAAQLYDVLVLKREPVAAV